MTCLKTEEKINLWEKNTVASVGIVARGKIKTLLRSITRRRRRRRCLDSGLGTDPSPSSWSLSVSLSWYTIPSFDPSLWWVGDVFMIWFRNLQFPFLNRLCVICSIDYSWPVLAISIVWSSTWKEFCVFLVQSQGKEQVLERVCLS